MAPLSVKQKDQTIVKEKNTFIPEFKTNKQWYIERVVPSEMHWEKSLHRVRDRNPDNYNGPAHITLRHRTEK